MKKEAEEEEDYLTEYDEFERENRSDLCFRFAYDIMHDAYFKFVDSEFKEKNKNEK
jgi:hypothetical protein